MFSVKVRSLCFILREVTIHLKNKYNYSDWQCHTTHERYAREQVTEAESLILATCTVRACEQSLVYPRFSIIQALRGRELFLDGTALLYVRSGRWRGR